MQQHHSEKKNIKHDYLEEEWNTITQDQPIYTEKSIRENVNLVYQGKTAV